MEQMRNVSCRVVSGCAECTNASECRVIRDNLLAAGAEGAFIGRPEWTRDMMRLSDRIRRHGWRYPSVRDRSQCWLHDKWAVARYLSETSSRLIRSFEDSTMLH